MKQYLIVIVVSFLLTLPNILHAASIHNSNSKAYLIKEKNLGGVGLMCQYPVGVPGILDAGTVVKS